jgi:hypothetical protein
VLCRFGWRVTLPWLRLTPYLSVAEKISTRIRHSGIPVVVKRGHANESLSALRVRTSAADPGGIPSLGIDANVTPSGSKYVEVGANLNPPEIGANLN